MHSLLIIGVVIVAVGYVIAKRMSGEPLNARDLGGPPLILTAIGVFQLTKVDDLTGVDIGWLVASALVGIACGVLRGATIVLFTREGVLWQRYTGKTIGVWLLSLIASGGFGLLATAAGMHADAKPLMLSIGVGMLGEMLSVGLRALSTGKPFSPQGRDSEAAHQHLVERFGDAANRVPRTGGGEAGAEPAGPGRRPGEPGLGESRRPGEPQPELQRSPKLSEGVDWLSNVVRNVRDDRRR
ncbi:MAG: DUF1453 domain-containing protein [Stackebrandtia sp.]